MPKNNQTIRFKTAYYFPKTVRAIGAVFGLFGLAMGLTSPVLAVLFIFITMVLFTTHYGFEIKLNPNTVREYIFILGLRDGKPSAFNQVEFIFIQPAKLRFLSYALQEKVMDGYEAFLKFEGRNEVSMLMQERKEKLIAFMEPVARQLQVSIRDYSEGTPVTVFEP